MRLLFLCVFGFALWWSWVAVHSSASIPFEIHAGIQERMSQLIVDTIKLKKPDAKDVEIQSIWTELAGQNRLVAHFRYSFSEANEAVGKARSTISGEGQLEKQSESSNTSGEQNWVLSNVKTTSDAVVFEDGVVLTASPQAPEEKN